MLGVYLLCLGELVVVLDHRSHLCFLLFAGSASKEAFHVKQFIYPAFILVQRALLMLIHNFLLAISGCLAPLSRVLVGNVGNKIFVLLRG